MAIANARLHRRVVRLSQTDALTGAANRRSLFARLEAELERSERFEHATALALVDVDHFKRFNEALGHPRATRCCARWRRSSARRCGRWTSSRATAARSSPWCSPAPTAPPRSPRRRSCGRAVEAAGIAHPAPDLGHVTISVGVAVYPDDGRDSRAGRRAPTPRSTPRSGRGGTRSRAHAPGMRDAPGPPPRTRTAARRSRGDEEPG